MSGFTCGNFLDSVSSNLCWKHLQYKHQCSAVSVQNSALHACESCMQGHEEEVLQEQMPLQLVHWFLLLPFLPLDGVLSSCVHALYVQVPAHVI